MDENPQPSAAPPLASRNAETLSVVGPDLTDLRSRAGQEPIEQWAEAVRQHHNAQWQRGDHWLVENYLRELPLLRSHLPGVINLIYQEVVLRVGCGEAPTLEEYLERFPEYQADLEALYAEEQAAARAAPAQETSPTRLPPALPDSPTLTHAPTKHDFHAPTPGEELQGLGGYVILEELGRGGMGVVYKAQQKALNRLVALKMILTGGETREEVGRFLREAEAAAQLEHPNIIAVHEVGRRMGQPYFSLEYVGGGSLADRLRDAALEPRDAVRLLIPVARAIHFAHCRGIIHRDLKPSNILLTADGVPKISDFGLAKRVTDDSALTQVGAIVGTPSYMAPEQARGAGPAVGPAADVYGLGAVLYELLTGRPPFKAARALDTILQVLSDEPIPPRRLQPKLPRDLETICLKCLQKDAASRYPSAGELAEDLERFLADEPIRARPPSLGQQLRHWVRRHRAAVQVAATVLLTLVAITGATSWWLGRQTRETAAALLQEGHDELRQADAAAAEDEAGRHYDAAMRHFAAARQAAPGNEPVEAMVDLHLHRCRRALDRHEFAVARGILLLLRDVEGADTRAEEIADCDRRAKGTGTWAVQTEPPGAAVFLAHVEENGHAGKSARVGTTPQAPQDIAPGSYSITLRHPQYADIVCPLFIDHGAAETVKVPLVKREDVPEGMVYVPPGEFFFGEPREGTRQRIFLEGYFIDRTEVTGEQYEKFVTATGARPPERWGGPVCPPLMRNEAVCNVSWFEALEYCRWAGKRLPTEQEWEKAARGTDGRYFPWGNRYAPYRAVCRDSLDERPSLVVGRRPTGASPYGCLDMAGNAWEWTRDREGPGRPDRVIRGGASYSNSDELLTFRRKGAPPGGSSYGGLNLLGFRCVKPLRPMTPPKSILDEMTSGTDLAEAAAFFWDQGRLDQVEACVERLLARNARSVPGNYWKAVLLDRKGHTADAIEPLQRVLAQRTHYETTARTQPPAPADLLRKLAKDNPAAATALELPGVLAQAMAAAGRKDSEAEALDQKVLTLDPDNEIAHEELAGICQRAGRAAEAERHRERWLAAYRMRLNEDPDNAETYDLIAEFLTLHRLQPAEAVRLADKAVQLEPRTARYRRTLAEAYHRAGRHQEAVAELNRAMELDPEGKMYRDLLDRYQAAARRDGK
jgi:formylglycine-generating enzyme required for sulfatase activity/tetratricopeptide (TPR) repeat protein/tRNA A-37 threonylcarbamoyl transferase component Bud32